MDKDNRIKHQIENGDATIIISKQKFMETASQCVVDSLGVFCETDMVKVFAAFLSNLTYELWDQKMEK